MPVSRARPPHTAEAQAVQLAQAHHLHRATDLRRAKTVTTEAVQAVTGAVQAAMTGAPLHHRATTGHRHPVRQASAAAEVPLRQDRQEVAAAA